MSGPTLESVVEDALLACRMAPYSDGKGGYLFRATPPELQAAHVAAAVLAWIEGRLADGDVLTIVARAIHGETIGDPAKGEPIVRVERATDDVIRDARAALAAVRGVLGAGVAQ